MHENILAALFVGYKKVKPDLFVTGSFNVAHPVPPIALPKPGGGTAYLDYRFELASFGFDIVPADQVFDSAADPFNLALNEAALYARVSMNFAGKHPAPWADGFDVFTWIKLSMHLSGGAVSFSLQDVQVAINNANNSSLLHVLNRLLADYLDSLVVMIKLPVALPLGALGSMSVSTVSLRLDSVDISATLR